MKKRLIRLSVDMDINTTLTKTGTDLLEALVASLQQNKELLSRLPNKQANDVIKKIDETLASVINNYPKDKANALKVVIEAESKIANVNNLPGHVALKKRLNQVNGQNTQNTQNTQNNSNSQANGQPTEQDVNTVAQYYGIPKQNVQKHLIQDCKQLHPDKFGN